MPAPDRVELYGSIRAYFFIEAMKFLALLVVGQRKHAAGFRQNLVSTEAIGFTRFSGHVPQVGVLQPLKSTLWVTHGCLSSAHNRLVHAQTMP
jgi:hypothetical protein